mmetsp:Transcript_32254/g.57711  ORF Transcript_32254/g.57711 Transcript_32254/m.57711 type:complete len:544 (-) Transcript_32254:75-1706(-)
MWAVARRVRVTAAVTVGAATTGAVAWAARKEEGISRGPEAQPGRAGALLAEEAEWAAFSAAAYFASLGRTAQVLWWALGTAAQYNVFFAAHPDGREEAEYRQALAELHRTRAVKLVGVLQANGGIYIKAGQLVSSLGAVPLEYRHLLQVLQDAVPARSMEEVETVLFREFGAHSAALFSSFEPQARAAASLAQVHRATLPNGEAVAVKVQYPGLELAVAHDLATIRFLADMTTKLVPGVRLHWVVESLAASLATEMDFQVEAQYAERMAAHLAERGPFGRLGTCTTPDLVPELCSRRVLTMEWVDGCKITDIDCLDAVGLSSTQVAELLLHTFADMTFRSGFIHGDMHAGNLLVRPSDGRKNSPEIVLLDHGVYVELDEDVRRSYAAMWCALILGDLAGATAAGVALAGGRAGALLPLLFQPGALSKEERRALREAHNIRSPEDVFQLIEEDMPPPLVQTIKIGSIVRTISGQLGVPPTRRLVVNAFHAASLQSRWQTRWAVHLMLWAVEARQWWLRCSVWVQQQLARALPSALLLVPPSAQS